MIQKNNQLPNLQKEYSLAEFKRDIGSTNDAEWFSDFLKVEKDLLKKLGAIGLREFKKQRKFKLDQKGYKLSTITNWNNEKDNDYFAADVEMACYLEFLRKSKATIKEAYTHVMSCLSNGTFHRFGEREHCQRFGTSINFRLEHWSPIPTILEDGDIVDAPKMDPIGIQKIKLTIDEPKVYISDWLRMENNALTKATQRPKRDPSDFKESILDSLNSEVGVIRSTKFFAERGIASFHVSNTSPELFEISNGEFVAARTDPDMDPKIESKKVGEVCTDLWNFTMATRGQLIKTLASAGNTEEGATKIVDDYLEKEEPEFFICEPGEYEYEFMGEYEDLKNNIDDIDLVGRGFEEVYFRMKRITQHG